MCFEFSVFMQTLFGKISIYENTWIMFFAWGSYWSLCRQLCVFVVFCVLGCFQLRDAAEREMDRSFTEQMSLPWVLESPFTRELLVNTDYNGKSKFHLLDPWHCIHLGIGKSWVACGVIMLQSIIENGTQDERIKTIAHGYRTFCRSRKLDPVIRKIELSTFGSATEPNGCWSKAAVTSNFMQFLEAFCHENFEKIQRDERLRVFVSFWH